MNTTPTPGDLSARHATTLKTMIHQSDDGAICICAECRALKAAIAALSALPAAGGGDEVARVDALSKLADRIEDLLTPWSDSGESDKKDAIVRDLRAMIATPQPSAAEDGGSPESAMQKVIDRVVDGVMGQREEVLRAFVAKYGFQPDEAVQVSGSDGSWRIIRRSDMYANQDAAVGAQGDGLRNVYLRDMEDTLRQLHSIVGMANPDVDALIEKVRRLTAPNSSVERVVDDMRKMAADRWTPYGVRQDVIAWADRLATPAAGKGVDAEELRKLIFLWRIREDNGEELTEFDKGYEQASDECAAHLEAALTRQPVAGDGMVLVPREPTPKMIDATWNDPAEAANGGGIESHNTRNARIYKAMLAAAPAATPTDGGEG